MIIEFDERLESGMASTTILEMRLRTDYAGDALDRYVDEQERDGEWLVIRQHYVGIGNANALVILSRISDVLMPLLYNEGVIASELSASVKTDPKAV